MRIDRHGIGQAQPAPVLLVPVIVWAVLRFQTSRLIFENIRVPDANGAGLLQMWQIV